MVANRSYFITLLLFILQLSVCYSENLLEDNKDEIQKICDKYKESYDDFVKKVKEDTDKKLNNKVEVFGFKVSDSAPKGRQWDYKTGKQYGAISNGIALRSGDIEVALYLRDYGCQNQSIFRDLITGDKQFKGPCEQLLEAMAIPNYIHGVCANLKRKPTYELESSGTFFLSGDYCFDNNDGVFTFTKTTTPTSCEKTVRVFARQLDNCNN